MADCIKGLIACIFMATAVCGPASAQMTFNPCLRPGPYGDVTWLPGCEFEGRPMPRGFNGGAIGTDFWREPRSGEGHRIRRTDYWRQPRPARENERCVRMTRHFFRAVEAEADARNFKDLAFRSERRANGDVAVYVPVILSVATAEEIRQAMMSARIEGFAYRGWEYAAVSGCR